MEDNVAADKKIFDFIKANKDHLTMTDMAYEMGVNFFVIKNSCAMLGIIPITKLKQTQNFILEYYKVKTLDEVARMLKYHVSYVRKFAKKMGVTFKKKEPDSDKPISVREILSGYKLGNVRYSEVTDHFLMDISNKFSEKK